MAQQIEVLNVLEKKLMALVELVKATTSTATATSSTPPRMHKSIEASVSQDLLFSTQVRLETLSLSHLSLAPSIRTTFRLQRTCWTCTKLLSFVSWPLNLSSHLISSLSGESTVAAIHSATDFGNGNIHFDCCCWHGSGNRSSGGVKSKSVSAFDSTTVAFDNQQNASTQ